MEFQRVSPPSHHLSATYRFGSFGDAEAWAEQVAKEFSGTSVSITVTHNEVTVEYSERITTNEPLNGKPVPPLKGSAP